ncbi:hypothetical protein FBU30_002739 [Linnemannia zychae]|nr:hypothetical protein FBU30_002739 [Linnemannia zychae]
MEGLKQFNNNMSMSNILSMNVPLDNFASTSSRIQHAKVLAICYVDETSVGPQTYVYSTCPSGSRACEQSRQGSISEEQTNSFVREMMMFCSSSNDGTVHPPKKTEEELKKDVKVDARLTITSNDSNMNTWYGFVSEGALFLRGNGWDEMDIRESVVAALDLAEEQLGCQTVHLCLEKSNPNLAKLVRTLMYAGFEMVHPDVLAHTDPKYLVLGMDL